MFYELHCHSNCSKGKKLPFESGGSPADIVRQADKAGLAGIALTDHDTIRGWRQAKAEARKLGLVFIPGLEISTKSGHVVGLGLNERVRPGMSVEDTVERIREQGGISVAVHPFDVRGDGIRYEMGKCDAIEVFNGLSIDRLPNRFCKWKAKGITAAKVGGSDSHMLETVGLVRNWIDADDMGSVLKEIKAGRVGIEPKYIPMGLMVKWIRQRLIGSYMDAVFYAHQNYSAPKKWVSLRMLRRFVMSNSNSWEALGRFGLGVTGGFVALKLAKQAFLAPY
ncbi:MAG: CehA/McbA family metallohydrolase [Candidatus Aenigmarchaeota archaeon]